MSFDYSVLEFLQGIRTAFVGDFAVLVSGLCNKILIIVVFCWLFWCGNKRQAYGIAMAFVFSAIAVQGLKIGFAVERPFVRWADIIPYEPALLTATGFSFPSGHTQVAASLLGYVALEIKKTWGRVLCFALVFLVMLSRMVLCVHTPTDVFVGFAITFAICAFVHKFQHLFEKNNSLKTAVFGSVLCAVLFLFTSVSVLRGCDFYMAEDSFEIAVISLVFFVLYYIEINKIEFNSEGTFGHKLMRFLLGIAGVLVLYFSVGYMERLNPEVEFVIKNIKNAVVFVWALCIYPMLIKRCGKI